MTAIDDSFNPYASPTVDEPRVAVDGSIFNADDAEAIRNRYLKHEASVRSIGYLYFLAAAFFIFAAVAGLFEYGSINPERAVIATVFLITFAAISLAMGLAIRALKRAVRIPVAIVSVLGLLKFPFGTLINGYILYLVFSDKGGRVFSPDYQEIIRQTPHIRYKGSLVVKILAAILIGLLAVGGAIALITQAS